MGPGTRPIEGVLSMSQVHPVLGLTAALDAALKDVADVDPVFMRTEDKAAALLALTRLAGQVEELRDRVLATASDVAEQEGARDAAAWLAHHARLARSDARRSLRLAKGCADRWTGLATARREGDINVAQAEVIHRALDNLPSWVDHETRSLAEARLIEEAAQFGPRELQHLGRGVLKVVAPEADEDQELRQLEREEDRAARTTYFHTRRNGDGTTDIRARVSDQHAHRLLTYLESFTSPRSSSGATGDDRRPYDQRLGTAFGAFLESVDPKRMPLHGGDATTILITVPLETLRTGLGTALVGDEPITAAEARRLACQATLIPAILGSDSEVLDLGRTQRLFQPAQRKAMAINQPTCRAAGCDIPATWCEAHHAGVPWGQGGGTDLADGVLLCSFHHHRAHDHHYDTRRRPDGRIEFHRRT
jgi:hypothetical protein